MRESHFVTERNSVFSTNADGAGSPFTHSIQRQNRSLFKWRREEGACGMRFVMIYKQKLVRISGQLLPNFAGHAQPVLCPKREGYLKGLNPFRCESQICLQEAFKLRQRFFIEDDLIQPGGGNPSLLQTKSDRTGRKSSISLAPRETFLLRGRNNFSVPDQRCRGIVIKR